MNNDYGKILVISDAHFGTPETSINNPVYASAMIDYIINNAPWEEIIFTGDLLDVNLSTFTRSIEGGTYSDLLSPLFGFREFLHKINAGMGKHDSSKSLSDVSGSWIYIPGNHDYKIWDMLSTKIICEDVLLKGERMGSIPTPLKNYTWRGLESFFAGIFREFNVHERVIVKYPNYEINIGDDIAVFTHGHYLDPSQTWWNNLHRELAGANSPEEKAKCNRRIFIETAQYQTAANAVSFTMRTRRFVSDLVGPEGLFHKLNKFIVNFGAWILKLIFVNTASMRNNIDTNKLLNIEAYVTSFCEYPKIPRWFFFGHTHHQEVARTPNLGIEVFNVGSFYPGQGMCMTFLEIETNYNAAPTVRLMGINMSGIPVRIPHAN